ncbi:hypothetical protein RI367_003843 [Sorochytrium milnesiophthora]
MTAAESTRPRRRPTSRSQRAFLERYFCTHPSPSLNDKEQLARELHWDTKAVHVWFQNRRHKAKKEQQRQPTPPRSASPGLVAMAEEAVVVQQPTPSVSSGGTGASPAPESDRVTKDAPHFTPPFPYVMPAPPVHTPKLSPTASSPLDTLALAATTFAATS